MAPKLGDTVFVTVRDPFTGVPGIETAIVTKTFTADDGEWAQNGDVVSVRTFADNGVDSTGLQTGPAELDEDGIWTSGYALTPDGEEYQSLSKVQASAPITENPTVSGQGVSATQVQSMIATANADLLASLRDMIGGTAEPAPATPTEQAGQDAAATTEAQTQSL